MAIIREQTTRSLISIVSPDHFDPDDRTGSDKLIRVPEHQRHPSWPQENKERLVDSVMLNYPVGQITLTKHNDCRGEEYFNVQDGQTRMGALQEFVMDKFPWNGKLYGEISPDERARFNNYTVQVDIFKKDRNMSQAYFELVICEIFERLNSGKPLSDNDKYWNRKETPVMKHLIQVRGSAEFGPNIRKYMWSNLGGGKGRSGLNHFVGLLLGLISQRAACISTSFMQNGKILTETTVVDAEGERRVSEFMRWYFGLLSDVFEYASWSVKRKFGKLSGVCGMIAVDWINGHARGHYDMWKKFIELQYSRENFERRLFADLPNGHARNVTEIAINSRIAKVVEMYNRDAFAEYSQDIFSLVLGSDYDSDDE